MLREIHIKNFAIIGDLSVSFRPGLNVLTGETGAGKSILIDALNLSIGGRAYSEHVKTGEDSATITAIFDNTNHIAPHIEKAGIPLQKGDELLLKRVISKTGKNRAFINDIPVSLGLINEISKGLIDIHGQHQHQSLFDRNFRLDMIDEFGNLTPIRKVMEELFTEFTRISRKIKHLERELRDKKQELELAEYQYNELKQANLIEDEEKHLEEEIKILSNAEKLYNISKNIYNKLYGGEFTLYNEIHAIRKEVDEIAGIDEKLKEQAASIQETEVLISEIAEFMLRYSESIKISPQMLEEANNRLSTLTQLYRKYGCYTNTDLINKMQELDDKLKSYSFDDEKLREYRDQHKVLKEKLIEHASLLSEKRKETSKRLEKLVMDEFKEFGLEKGRFKIEFKKLLTASEEKKDEESLNGIRYTSRGFDEIEFLFSANPGADLKSLNKVGSGGEISRVMLALKTNLAKVDRLDTLIFDEIDTGIGGATASSIGKRLKKLSMTHQVLAVTHLPQIASFADNHLKVEKYEEEDKTSITVERLEGKKRVHEISRMLSGDLFTDTSIKHAEELLKKGVN